jgi:HlyD family secretion protein
MNPIPRPNRHGALLRRLLIALAILGILGTGIWWGSGKIEWETKTSGPLMHEIKRGPFLHEIIELGNVESSNNVEVRCEVKANHPGATILWLIPEGTHVKKGELIAKFDSAQIEKELIKEKISLSECESTSVKAQLDLESAEIAKNEYVEGTYPLEKMQIDSKLFNAKDDRSKAKQQLTYSLELAKKGYATDLRVETDRVAVEKAKNQYASAECEMRVLHKFKHHKQLKELNSKIESAKAHLLSSKSKLELAKNRVSEVEDQLKKCEVSAKADGQVVYVVFDSWRNTVVEAGAQIRRNETFIRLPDPTNMQVVAKVNEAKVSLLRPELPVVIRLDSMPDVELLGEIEKVDEYPDSGNRWSGGNIKKFKTTIEIHNDSVALKPGMTAEARIQVDYQPDMIQAPVQAIFEHGKKHYAISPDKKSWKAVEVEIGASNDKTVIIKKGLTEGEQVVLGAFAMRDKVELPNLETDKNGKSKNTKDRDEEESTKLLKFKIAKTSDDFFKKWDVDMSGQLDEKELPKTLKSILPKIDLNEDKLIDSKEWEQYEEGRKAGRIKLGAKKKAAPKPTVSKKEAEKKKSEPAPKATDKKSDSPVKEKDADTKPAKKKEETPKPTSESPKKDDPESTDQSKTEKPKTQKTGTDPK